MAVTRTTQFLLVLMVGLAHVVTCNSLYGNETDRLSLLEFEAISLDPREALVSWNDSTHFCGWEGVLCRVKTPHRVTSLNLTNRDLVGKISPSIGNLTFLKHLFLERNAFAGEIPASLSHLHRLQTLSLTNNMLTGTIPNFSNCSSLKVLVVAGNNLAGGIPIDLPPNLQLLALVRNSLTGTIPAYVANITTLIAFSCASNNIEGNIPNEFAKLPRLQTLYVGGNKLSGRFQQAILNISTLVRLSMAFNVLSGEVPYNIGNHLPNLQLLHLDSNLFEGHIPPSLVNASNLFHLDMSRNKFTGVIPGSIGRLVKLSVINLEVNNLQARNEQDWEFVNSLANCTDLYIFSVQENDLQGHVPSSLGNLSIQLQQLLFGENQLTGSFPSGIANLPNLSRLSMDYNQFTGVIPQWLGSLRSLQQLYLSNNKFTGFIPSSLSNLSQLTELKLQSNQLTGHLPASFGGLQQLTVLNISNNNLYGSIPKEIFGIPTILKISISFNNLSGELPIDIGNAKQLIVLELSSNNISGRIPKTLGNCESLEDMKLGSNMLSGSIPASLGNISSLKLLDFSNNNLTGLIPTSLGNLQLLGYLNLSLNHLEGEVPTKGVFKNATTIWIDRNQGLCGGTMELHLPACLVMSLNSSRHKLFLVLKVVIPVVSMLSLAMVILVLLFWRGKRKRKSLSLPSFGRKFPKVSFIDLARATEDFSPSNLLGRGQYGSVYQGKLIQGGNDVAIKVFKLETRGAQKSFIAECNALRNVRHRNLVPILTACSSIDSNGNDFKALVYVLMPRGDLHRLLYSSNSTQDYESSSILSHIPLSQRLSIAVDIADALEYLHHNNQGTIVHCDLKPRNILLDDNMTAHVGDLGLASFKMDSTVSSGDSNSTTSIAIKGTIGYIAPECATGGQVSTASDVYSFGIVLLEMFLRKMPTDDMFKDGLSIANFVEMSFPDRISQIVDPELLQDHPDFPNETQVAMKEKDMDCLISVLNIGLCCTKLSPSERLNMQDVAARLHGLCCTKLSPSERLNMQDVAARLHGIREAYLGNN